ncbi:hypothetical protein L292_0065 [Acinetobacter junii CIP 107470 = MTCC 11364]|uniref:Uncharacterized protein n=1 Tax=Acinetobacter junii CIP 107470 = MTCC 11364 TaxID=1217666 RepID=S7WU42_ACIJU|nr:hypothetical protein L292_0065 [Acinetobacter junii CIP 107470 = MTCC 11364]
MTFHYDSPSLAFVLLAAKTFDKDFDRRFIRRIQAASATV